MGKPNSPREILRQSIKSEYLQFRKDSCEECGLTASQAVGRRDEDGWLITRTAKGGYKLTVHHIDGDITNNKPENLQTLCRICHEKKHM